MCKCRCVSGNRSFSVVVWLSTCHIDARMKDVAWSILRLAISVDFAAIRSVLLLECLEMVMFCL